MFSRDRLWTAAAAGLLLPRVLTAQAPEQMRDTGVSALWILANLSYAGMRAQDHPSTVWRIVAFIFGFPGTLVTFLVVREGGGSAYGVQLPRAGPAPQSGASPDERSRS